MMFRARFRRMPLTRPPARGFLQCFFVSSTDSFTAAVTGILVRKSIWYSPRRRLFLTLLSIFCSFMVENCWM